MRRLLCSKSQRFVPRHNSLLPSSRLYVAVSRSGGGVLSDTAWTTSHSVDSRASLESAWAFMTNVANWDDPPATFELAGPFTTGTQGKTCMPEQEPRVWRLGAVKPEQSYVMEMQLDGAALSFEWCFDRLTDGTRLTQNIVLRGEKVAAYASLVEAAFASNLAAGMKRIAEAMDRAQAV